MRHLILSLGLLLSTVSPGWCQSVGSAGDPATRAMVDLTTELRTLIELLGARADFEQRSAGIQQVTALDHSVIEVDNELRRTLEQRETLSREIAEVESHLAVVTRNRDSDSVGALIAENLEGAAAKDRADLLGRRERLGHLDRRVDELRATLARRQALRATVESELGGTTLERPR